MVGFFVYINKKPKINNQFSGTIRLTESYSLLLRKTFSKFKREKKSLEGIYYKNIFKYHKISFVAF